MTSMHVLPAEPSDRDSAQHWVQHAVCHSTNQEALHGGSKSVKDIFRGGYPTPPVTTDMATMAIPNGNTAYQQYYGYQKDRRPATMDSLGTKPAAFSTVEKQSTAEYENKAYSNGYTYPLASVRQDEDQIAPYLQIPNSVNSSKGSLPEFAADITCLLWFETSATIEYAEVLPVDAKLDRVLAVDAIPSVGFKKWVTSLISTTQIAPNVILLALMFIHRLKKFNPGVSGKRGSEFRLLTIALMLGNKFLDDNTYTNPTWAEVSGIPVKEIHIMEVEFLSNMRYELYASETDWLAWKSKLGRLGSFYEKAALHGSLKAPSPTTPTTQVFPHKLPSPPSGSRYSNARYVDIPNPLHTLPRLPRSPTKNYSTTEYPIDRKRSLDTSFELPSAKRVHSSLSTNASLSPIVYTPNSALTPNSAASYIPARLPQLPIPMLPNNVSRNGLHLTPLSLPGPRAMSTVYPTTSAYSQPVTPTTAGSSAMLPVSTGSAVMPMPISRMPSYGGSTRTSPTNIYGTSTPTRPGLSPSYFLANRSSPYRPVRNVNTLLYPPPSAAMSNPTKNIDYQQIHYQPLSKQTGQLHTGPMPNHHHLEARHNPILTPSGQTYRSYQ